MEGATQGTRCESVLKDYFGGMFGHELIAEGGKYSERPEPFYYINLDIKNMRNLDQALEAYIAGEVGRCRALVNGGSNSGH